MDFTKLFRGLLGEGEYPDLRADLRRARIPKSPKQYLKTAIPLSIIVGAAIAFGVFFITWNILGFPLIYMGPLSVGLGVAASYGIYRVFLVYPSMAADERSKKIDAVLPHASAFMLALSKGGIPPIDIFRSLGAREDEYGEIAKEARAVVRNVEYLGHSPLEAIIDVAQNTPSQMFREFLEPLTSVIETGSDMRQFLADKCEQYYEEAEAEQRRSFEKLAIYGEIYVISLGLGPFLALMLWIPMSMIGSFPAFPVKVLVYVGIPVGSVVFALLIDRISRPTPEKERFGGLEKSKSKGPSKGGLLEGLWSKETTERIKSVLSSPIQTLTERPIWVMWVSAPAALIFAVFWALTGHPDITTMVFSALISLGPFASFYELRRRRVGRIIEATPNFLTTLSGAVSSGITPPKAIKTISPSRFGDLAPELRKVKRDVEWGNTTTEALLNLEKRIRSGLLARVIAVMEKASEAAANIADVLSVLARDVSMEISLKRERAGVSFVYVAIIYLIFFVFLACAIGMVFKFLPSFPLTAAGGVALGRFGGGGVDPEVVKTVFFHAVLLQGVFSGIIAGQLSTGDALVGLKHSLIMLFIGWFAFTFWEIVLAPLPF